MLGVTPKQEDRVFTNLVLKRSSKTVTANEEQLLSVFFMVEEDMRLHYNITHGFESLDLMLYYFAPSLRDAMIRFFRGESKERLKDLANTKVLNSIDVWLDSLIQALVNGNKQLHTWMFRSLDKEKRRKEKC